MPTRWLACRSDDGLVDRRLRLLVARPRAAVRPAVRLIRALHDRHADLGPDGWWSAYQEGLTAHGGSGGQPARTYTIFFGKKCQLLGVRLNKL